MSIQGLLSNEKESLITRTVTLAKHTVLVIIQIYLFQNYVSWMLLIICSQTMGAKRNIVPATISIHISDHY